MRGRDSAVTVARWARDLWMAFGVALFAFGMLEGAYIGQRAIRAALFGSDEVRDAQTVGHPYAGEEWYKDFLNARESGRKRFDAWRGYTSYPGASRYLHVDSAGYRVTVQPDRRAPDAATSGRTVFLLGGSAMWGYTSRDSLTIASLVASELYAAGIPDVTVVNLAQPGYTAGHELATLVQELLHGAAPAVVVFFDGVNDIRSTQLYQEPGHVFLEPRLRHLFEVEGQRGFFGSLASAGERSRLINRIILALGLDHQWTIPPRTDGSCQRLGSWYHNVHRSAVALGHAWSFDVLFVQQPIHATTRKPLTKFEQSFMPPDWNVAYSRDCAAAIDEAMADMNGTSYLTYASIFDDVTETVFIDEYGHVTEAGNRRIAGALARQIARRLEQVEAMTSAY